MSDASSTPDGQLDRNQSFRLGALLIAPATNEVDGVRVDTKTMDVLVALADAAMSVISVAQLLERVWPNVVVGDNVVHQAITHLRKVLGDDPRAPRYVQSIPKRGYRLIAPVARMPAGSVEHNAQKPADGLPDASLANPQGWFDTNTPRGPASFDTSSAQGPSPYTSTVHCLLAVLAFENLSGDPDLAYFSDGVSDEIRDTVSRGADLRVIGRASSFQFRGADKAAAHVAAEVNATHILDGAVRRSGDRVRISAELVECATSTTLWSKRFEHELTDVFALQDEIASAVAQALRVAFAPSRQTAAINVGGFDLYLRARAAATGWLGALDSTLLAAAVAREPRLTQAWASLALSLALQAYDPIDADPLPPLVVAELRRRALHATERAFALDAEAAHAHTALAVLEPVCGAFAQREIHLRRALAAAPDDPFVLGRISYWCRGVGRLRETLVHQARAYEIDPLIPVVTQQYMHALRGVGRGAEADVIYVAARARWPELFFFVVAALDGASLRGDWKTVDRLLADVRVRGPHSPIMFDAIEEVERRREGFAVAGANKVAMLRRQLSETGTVSMSDAATASHLGFVQEVYPIVLQASFVHLFQPGGRLMPRDFGTHWLLGRVGPLQRDTRFVQLCAKLGLCDYWVKSDTWPDCAEQLEDYYDFKAEARRLVSSA